MSSPGNQHVTSRESTDNGKIYGRAVCYIHKELISLTHMHTHTHTHKKLNFLAASEVKCCNRCHPQMRIKVVILYGGYLGLWGGGDI
jgi:hypothetical protein